MKKFICITIHYNSSEKLVLQGKVYLFRKMVHPVNQRQNYKLYGSITHYNACLRSGGQREY